MGGYGSGRPREKTTVEECLVLSAAKLQRDKLIRTGTHGAGILTWTRVSTGEKLSSIGYEVNILDRADAWVRLHYTRTRDKEDVDFRVQLTTTPLP